MFRISDANGAPHPWYGEELQTGAVAGLMPEAVAHRIVSAADGRATSEVRLLGPDLGDGYNIGPRIAPSLRARGWIGAVAEAAIRDRGSADVQNRLGLSGRVRLVDAGGISKVGRFGWKASRTSLEEQIASAFAADLGLSSPLRPEPYGDCTNEQRLCRTYPNGESAAFEGREISSTMLDAVADYVASLDGPSNDGPASDAPNTGETVLAAAGCTGCHVPHMPAETGGSVGLYSDLLLHDMGPDLDDGVSEPGVRSSEWRTAPLVDLSTRGGQRRYLHDGRAASISEAVGWHGGEARASRQAFETLPPTEREALIRFLETR